MNVPQLRFSGFDGEWELKRIKDIAPLQRGFDLVKENIVPGKYPIGYSNGILGFHNEYKAKGPGVFTGRSGTIGNIHFTESDYWPHNTSLWVTDFKGNNEKFIYYFYKKVDLKKYNAGSTVPTLNRNDVHDLKRAIPKRKEQEKIADFLTLLEKRIEKQQEKIEKLELVKKGMMQKVFSQELRFKDEDEDWRKVKLRDVCTVSSGKRLPKGHSFVKEGIPYISVSDMGEKFVSSMNFSYISIDTEKIISKYKVHPGDIIISIAGTLGKVNLIDSSLDKANLTENCNKISEFKGVINTYIFYYLKSDTIQRRIKEMSTTSSQPKLALDRLRDFPVLLPSESEQKKISILLSNLDKKIEKEKEKLMVLEEQKKGFMQEMFV